MANKPEQPDADTLKALALALLNEQSTLTLATARVDVPWAAPVYYINRDFDCFFFSSPDSRHIKEAIGNRKAAGTVFAPGITWQAIKGLQMSGGIQPQRPNLTTARLVKRYVEKFSFTLDFFKSGQPLDLDAFQRRFNVNLYRFRPATVYYLDNRIGFGFRKKIAL